MTIDNKEITSRWNKYQALLEKKDLSSLILTSPAHIFYAANFAHLYKEGREAIAIVKKNRVFLIVPAMHQGQVDQAFTGITKVIVPPSESFWGKVTEIAEGKAGFEADDLRYLEFAYLKKGLKRLIPLSQDMERVRMIKSQKEIEKIRQVEIITQQALEGVVKTLEVGQTELEVARKLDMTMEELGATGVAFPTIVAFGKNSANPHYLPGKVKLEENQPILIDMGAAKDGYNGDLTRTYFIGQPDEQFIGIYKLVALAQKQAFAQIKPGAKVKTVDNAVRKVYKKMGELEYFLHTTGHGLGIDVHESPSIAWTQEDELKPGMVFTVEPGLYYPGWGGVRIEDVAVVTSQGYELLSTLDRELQVLPVKR